MIMGYYTQTNTQHSEKFGEFYIDFSILHRQVRKTVKDVFLFIEIEFSSSQCDGILSLKS